MYFFNLVSVILRLNQLSKILRNYRHVLISCRPKSVYHLPLGLSGFCSAYYGKETFVSIVRA